MTEQSDHQIFDNLFVLELANNHWGSLERGLKIIEDFGKVVRDNDVYAAIKLQLRDVDTFIHDSFFGYDKIRYIKKTAATRLNIEEVKIMIEEISKQGCIPMATPFDEKSVVFCGKLDLPIIKVASSDIASWSLLKQIAKLNKPVIISTGGSSNKMIDDCVNFFAKQNIPLAINHCVSLYPSEDRDLELHQIDYLKKRYPNNTIGFSSHEKTDWRNSMLISYAKGARTWERHIDIEFDNVPVSPYCSLPNQIDEWFKAFHKGEEMCGNDGSRRRNIPEKEIRYLDELLRGLYAKRDLPEGYQVSPETINEDFYLAIPLHKGQLSCREDIDNLKIKKQLLANEQVTLDHVDEKFTDFNEIKTIIEDRGLSN